MADVTEIVAESAVEMITEADKETKNVCEAVENKMDEKGDNCPPPASEDAVAEAVKETSEVDTSEQAVESCTAAECTAAEPCAAAEPCTVEVSANTTEGTPAGGVKRKSEEDDDCSEVTNEDSKKVKTDDSAEVETPEPVSESKEEPVVVNGGSVPENNGCHEAPDATNGQTCDDIPPEIVTKTVEEVMNQPEDIAASS
jgi:hypothetical protein